MFALTFFVVLNACRSCRATFTEFGKFFDCVRFGKSFDSIDFDQFRSQPFCNLIATLEQVEPEHEALPAFKSFMRFANFAQSDRRFRTREAFENKAGFDFAIFEATIRTFGAFAEEQGVKLF